MIKVLVSGVPGTGKSTVCREISKLGYESHDFEDYDGMFDMYRKDTGEIFDNYDNSNPENVKNADWLCDVSKLKDLLEKQTKEIAFYCGIASNSEEITPLFDKIIVLRTNKEYLHKRLSTREGTDDLGNNEEGRQLVLGWKDWWENEMKKHGAIFINADENPEVVAGLVVKKIE